MYPRQISPICSLLTAQSPRAWVVVAKTRHGYSIDESPPLELNLDRKLDSIF